VQGNTATHSGDRFTLPQSQKDPNLHIVNTSSSSIDVTYKWNVENFLDKVLTSSCGDLDSPEFSFPISGFQTQWNLSIRSWQDEAGHNIASPIILCLNLVSCSELRLGSQTKQMTVTCRLGIQDRRDQTGEEEVCITLRPRTVLESVSYRNLEVGEQHSGMGDVKLEARLSISWADTEASSDLLLSYLHKTTQTPDVLLKAGDRQFPAHSQVISAHSPFLSRLISSTPPECDTRQIVLLSLSTGSLSSLLLYMYTGSLHCVGEEWGDILTAAVTLEMESLKQRCEEELTAILRADNVARVLLLAECNHCPSLKKSALSYCCEHIQYIIKDSVWKTIEEERPSLFEEAVAEVEPVTCGSHTECIKMENRYQMERRMEASICQRKPCVTKG